MAEGAEEGGGGAVKQSGALACAGERSDPWHKSRFALQRTRCALCSLGTLCHPLRGSRKRFRPGGSVKKYL